MAKAKQLPDLRKYIDTADAAIMLDVSPARIRQMVAMGRFSGKLEIAGRTFLPKSEVEKIPKRA